MIGRALRRKVKTKMGEPVGQVSNVIKAGLDFNKRFVTGERREEKPTIQSKTTPSMSLKVEDRTFMPPKEEPIAKIERDPKASGNFKYSVGGKDFNLTREQYNNLIKAQGFKEEDYNGDDETIKELLYTEKLERDIRNTIKGKKEEAYNEMVKQKASERVLGELPKDEQDQKLPSEKNYTMQDGEIVEEVGGLPEQQGKGGEKLLVDYVNEFMPRAYDAWDSWSKLVTGGDVRSVTDARRVIGEAETLIKQQIDNVAIGGSSQEAQIGILIMEQQLNILEAKVKNKNFENPRYFIRSGLPLMSEIVIYKSQLAEHRKNLDIASQQAQLNKAYGFS